MKGSAEGRPESRDSSGLVRHRLTTRLLDPASYLVGCVVAPAGSGKSRLLAHVALASGALVAWCGTPDPVPRSERALAAWLWDGLGPVLGAGREAPAGVQGVLDALTGPGPALLVIVDDVHLVEGSDAEFALADLVRRLPARMRLLMASRVDLAIDLTRLRVSGQLVEIGPDDLRFRAWEVEELFRDVYRDPLIPEDVATLARRTAGWAAYLQLFHLATARKPVAEKRRVLASLANRAPLVQEYLTRHVLAELSPDLQDFLIRTSVLRRPTVALCDELLGWEQGSRQLLAELERRQLFTDRLDDDSYRYHTVLLSYLEARLDDAVGAKAARDEHRRAAVLLEREGLTEDAAAAFAKAEDWEGVARTLGHPAESAASLGGAWLEALPPTVVETDALLLMARARRALASGALTDAVATMRAAEAVAASSVVAERCHQERDRIGAWMSPSRPGGTDWLAVLRRGTQRQPREAQLAATSLAGATGRFAEGASAFLAGDMLSAWRLLRGVSAHADAPPALTAGAQLMAMVAGLMCGRVPDPDELDRLRDEAEAASIPWLERMATAAVVLAEPGSGEVLEVVADACQREGDRWGEALVTLMYGTSCLWRRQVGIPYLQRAARIFADLGAGVCETTACAYLALCACAGGDRDLATGMAHHARTLASLREVPGAAGVAALALARLSGDEAELARAQGMLEPLGTWTWHERLASGQPGRTVGETVTTAPTPPPALPATAGWAASDLRSGALVRLRCLGGFSVTIGSRPVDESAAKPMERALLHLLAARAGEPVHREALIVALWPEADPDAGRHRLQVAISALRRLLAVDSRSPAQVLAREGDSYRLALPDDSECDVWQFSASLRRAGAARGSGADAAEEEALEAALNAYGGPLLPGDGPADWVVDRRAALQQAAADAAARLANLRLGRGDHRARGRSGPARAFGGSLSRRAVEAAD